MLDDTLYSLYHFFLSFLLLRYFISLAFFFPNLIDRHFLARFYYYDAENRQLLLYCIIHTNIHYIIQFHSFIHCIPQSDDEVVDPMPAIREECKVTTCNSGKTNYEACVKRITENKFGDCEAWYFDWLKCADKCIAPKIFGMTKE